MSNCLLLSSSFLILHNRSFPNLVLISVSNLLHLFRDLLALSGKFLVNHQEMATKAVKKLPPGFMGVLKNWAYNTTGFCQLGLKHDDCLHETPDVEEALRRLPKKAQDERNFRMIRALQLSMTKTILPRDQWTKYEEDDHYLKPYLDEVVRERKEKEEWNKNY